MAYFIFSKNCDDLNGTLYRIAENEYDFNNLNIINSHYKIIEDSQSNFDAVKYGIKNIIKYNNNTITYQDISIVFEDHVKEGVLVKSGKEYLNDYISNLKIIIKQFTGNNPNHQLFNRWNNYYNQLSSLNLDNITYPLNKSLEKYFNDSGQPSYNILQLP